MCCRKATIIWLPIFLVGFLLVGCTSGLDVQIDHFTFEGESEHWKAKFDYSYKEVFYHDPETKLLEYDNFIWAKLHLFFKGPDENASDVSWELQALSFRNSGSGYEFQGGVWTVASSSTAQKGHILERSDELTLTLNWGGESEAISLKVKKD